MEDDLIGQLGVIENANSPHNGEVVVVVKVEGDMLTVEPNKPAEFDFAHAKLSRKDVRIL